ncbi:hypothetical protein D3C76_1532670 [compost metagenome]
MLDGNLGIFLKQTVQGFGFSRGRILNIHIRKILSTRELIHESVFFQRPDFILNKYRSNT